MRVLDELVEQSGVDQRRLAAAGRPDHTYRCAAVQYINQIRRNDVASIIVGGVTDQKRLEPLVWIFQQVGSHGDLAVQPAGLELLVERGCLLIRFDAQLASQDLAAGFVLRQRRRTLPRGCQHGHQLPIGRLAQVVDVDLLAGVALCVAKVASDNVVVGEGIQCQQRLLLVMLRSLRLPRIKFWRVRQ